MTESRRNPSQRPPGRGVPGSARHRSDPTFRGSTFALSSLERPHQPDLHPRRRRDSEAPFCRVHRLRSRPPRRHRHPTGLRLRRRLPRPSHRALPSGDRRHPGRIAGQEGSVSARSSPSLGSRRKGPLRPGRNAGRNIRLRNAARRRQNGTCRPIRCPSRPSRRLARAHDHHRRPSRPQGIRRSRVHLGPGASTSRQRRPPACPGKRAISSPS
jgi:hypothetical protein